MNKIFLCGVIVGAEKAKMLSEEEGVEVVDTEDLSGSEIQPICPTGYEDWPIYKTPSIEQLKNNETWRGSGKRRKSMCK